MRTNDVFPGRLPDPDSFCAFDEDVVFSRIQCDPRAEYIGGAYRESSGPKRDLWRRSCMVALAGPPAGCPMNSTEDTRGAAAKEMRAAYERYLAGRPGANHRKPRIASRELLPDLR